MARRFNRKPLSDEERDARRKADRDRIEQAARALLTSDGWQRWIRVFVSNGLSRYSVSNRMLIAIDCWSRGITPTYVAGFRAFLDLNRCVRRDLLRARAVGLDVGGESIPYIAGWGEDGALEAIRQYAHTIDTIARRIEDAFDPKPAPTAKVLEAEALAA